ncbi:MAG: glycoside hydrolase family protein [Eubacterium sp.]|nr:glycoside hydrolase family protein [Eubacterium sp.]
MRTSSRGIQLIKSFEGCRLAAYRDANNVWTIGWGITNADKAVTGKTIKEGLKITQPTAEKWLIDSIKKRYEPKVEKYEKIYHWNQNQFDALVSFAYNIGSIDQLTNEGKRDKETIARKILEYNKSGGRVLEGLVRRRKAEHDLFCEPMIIGYPGYFPELPKRGWYIKGDGITTNVNLKGQIKRAQRVLNWVLNADLVVDGMYGEKTVAAVKKLQKMAGLAVNGKFGDKCLAICKEYKKVIR